MKIELDTTKPFTDILSYVEQNKEEIKVHSAAFAKQVQLHILHSKNLQLQDDYKQFDGFDAINYRLWLIKNQNLYSDMEKEILKNGNRNKLSDQDYH